MMKKVSLFFMSIILISMSAAYAQFPTVNIQNFTGTFQNQQGQANASLFKIPESDFGDEAVNFEVFMQAGNYVLRANDQEFTWENPPSEISDVESLKWSGVTVQSNQSRLNLKVGSLQAKGKKDSLSLVGLNLSCNYLQGNSGEQINELLHSCLNHQGNLAIRSMGQNKLKSMNSIANINFKLKKNGMMFNLSSSGLNIHGNGKVWYLADQSLVKIRIDRAKWKFMNVKSKLFNELKDLESDTVSVHNPWIEIKIEK